MITEEERLERIARRWHEKSDHAADGEPFGGMLCNCRRLAIKIKPLLEEAYGDGARMADNAREHGQPYYGLYENSEDQL